jgi:hypothetical protein
MKVTGGAGTFRHIISKPCCATWGNPFAHWDLRVNSSNQISFGIHNVPSTSFSTANGATTISADGVWKHVAGTFDGTVIKVYLNGKLDGSTNLTSTVGTTGSENIAIGTRHTAAGQRGEYFSGSLDAIRVFDYARTSAQIAYDYNRGAPVGYWKMDECQGTTINDSSGNSLSGTWSGSGGSNTSAGNCNSAGTAWGDGVTGKRNYSMDFDGSDDTVNFGSPTLLKLTDSIGISMWVKPDSNALSSGEHAMIHNYDGGGTTGQYEVAFINGALEFNYGAASSYVSYNPTPSISFTAGNWYHIVFTHSGSNSTGYFYVNGVKYSTNRTGSATIPSGGYGNTVVGATTYSGQLDDIKMFNYTLTDSQAKLIYNDGATRYGPTTGSP